MLGIIPLSTIYRIASIRKFIRKVVLPWNNKISWIYKKWYVLNIFNYWINIYIELNYNKFKFQLFRVNL